MTKCAVVNSDRQIVNVIMADPAVDSIPGMTLIDCPDEVSVGYIWSEAGFEPGPEMLARLQAEQEAEEESIEQEALED